MIAYFMDGPWKGKYKRVGGDVVYAIDDRAPRRIVRYWRTDSHYRPLGSVPVRGYEMDPEWER